jgi:hypothetical protein
MMTTVWAGRGIGRVTRSIVEAWLAPTATEAPVGSPIDATAKAAASRHADLTSLTVSGVATAKTDHGHGEKHDNPRDHDG